MGRSPFLKSILFWGSFYVFYHYSSREPLTNRQKYPSYAIFKEKMVRDTWRDGFNGDKMSKDWGHFTMAFKDDVRSLFK
jgi:ribonucleotide reductase beta subunit family protein with ferritin-like domain